MWRALRAYHQRGGCTDQTESCDDAHEATFLGNRVRSGGGWGRIALRLRRASAGKQDRAVERVAERFSKARPDARSEPVANVRSHAAHQAAMRGAAFEHGADHRTDSLRCFLHDQLA